MSGWGGARAQIPWVCAATPPLSCRVCRLQPGYLSKFKEESLFYIFYSMPQV